MKEMIKASYLSDLDQLLPEEMMVIQGGTDDGTTKPCFDKCASKCMADCMTSCSSGC